MGAKGIGTDDSRRIGSWGTVETGATEWLSDLLGGGKTGQGGSDIIPNQEPAYEPVFNTRTTNIGGQVKGVNTSNVAKTPTAPTPTPTERGEFVGQIVGNRRWTGVGWEDAGMGGNDGGVSGQDISDAYAPAIAALQGYIDAAQTGAAADIENIGTRVKNQSGQLDVQEGELMGETQISQNKFHEDLTSALQDAIRSYNALAQQGNARFGRGSSAGGAVGELAQQEFFRQQGGVQKQGLSGDLQFEGEKTKIKNFVAKGKQDLDMYLNEATTEIQKGLRQTLADINSRRGDIETNKTRDRLSALQTAKETAQRVSEANVTYRQGLITTALSNMQSVAGRAFTPTEIAANLRELQNLIFGNSGGFTTLASPQTVARTRAFTDVEDPYAQTQVGQ